MHALINGRQAVGTVVPPPSAMLASRPMLRPARRPAATTARLALRVACIATGRDAPQVETAPVVFKLRHKASFGEQVRVVGSDPALGKWKVEGAAEMKWTDGDVWSATVDVPVGEELEFKFVVVKDKSAVWETTPNRKLNTYPSVTLEVSTQWNDPMAELEARAISVQDVNVLDFLNTSYPPEPLPKIPAPSAAVQQPTQAALAAPSNGTANGNGRGLKGATAASSNGTAAPAAAAEGKLRVDEEQQQRDEAARQAEARLLEQRMAEHRRVQEQRMAELQKVKQQMEAARARMAAVEARMAQVQHRTKAEGQA